MGDLITTIDNIAKDGVPVVVEFDTQSSVKLAAILILSAILVGIGLKFINKIN